MTAFVLQFAQPKQPELLDELEKTRPATYDPALQMSILQDGTPACQDQEWMELSGTTTSTAGSKTHFDD